MDTSKIGIIIGVAGIVIGLATAYYFYRKSTRNKQPMWAIRSHNLVRGYSSSLENMRVLYRDQLVSNITSTKVLFWNEGRLTIDAADIVDANPLRLVPADGVHILDAKILVCNRESTRFQVELVDDGSAALLRFDYLDQRNGAVVQVVHDGTSSEDISLAGDIKGVSRLLPRPLVPSWVRFFSGPIGALSNSRRAVTVTAFIIAVLYMVNPLLTLLLEWAVGQHPPQTSQPAVSPFQVAGNAVSFLGGLVLLSLALAFRRSYSFAPVGLEVFYD